MSSKRGRRTLGKVLAVFAVLATALVVGLSALPGTARAEETPATPGYMKTLTPNDDGTYTVSLDVTGSVSKTTEDRTPIDVVVVLDTSGSMDKGKGTSTMDRAKKAIRTLADTLLANNKDGAIQMSLVTFSNNAQQ